MKKMINSVKIEGRIYQHNLEIKQVQNRESANFGKDFISGTIDIATDENLLNVIPVHFTYVTETTNSGNKNENFTKLKKIIESGKTVIECGKDEALKVRINTALALNDFYNNQDELVSAKRNEGGFITIISDLCEEKERNTFTVDMVITSAVRVMADEEKHIDKDYVLVKGSIFNFRNDLLPIDFIVRSEKGMTYFEDLGASNAEPVFTKIWGEINCGTIVSTIEEDTAFGEAAVRTYEKKIKEWIITKAAAVPYDFGDETILTMDELKKAAQDREIRLADVKKRNDDYKASKTTSSAPTSMAAAATVATQMPKGQFNF